MKPRHVVSAGLTVLVALSGIGLVTAQPEAAQTPLITQGIKVDLPEADAEVVEEQDESLEITINAEGQYFINVGEVPAENPEPVPVEEVGERVAKIMNQNPTIPVFIGGDATVDYGVIMKLMSTLQEAGVKEPRLLTQPPGLEL